MIALIVVTWDYAFPCNPSSGDGVLTIRRLITALRYDNEMIKE
jgi:hypothetical protein